MLNRDARLYTLITHPHTYTHKTNKWSITNWENMYDNMRQRVNTLNIHSSYKLLKFNA